MGFGITGQTSQTSSLTNTSSDSHDTDISNDNKIATGDSGNVNATGGGSLVINNTGVDAGLSNTLGNAVDSAFGTVEHVTDTSFAGIIETVKSAFDFGKDSLKNSEALSDKALATTAGIASAAQADLAATKGDIATSFQRNLPLIAGILAAIAVVYIISKKG